jgi:hypothetical protein
MDKTKRVSKGHVSNIFLSKQNICASRRETIPLCKSKTSLGKAMIIFSDSIFGDGLQEALTGFQLFKSAVPNSSMAPSYEHFSV